MAKSIMIQGTMSNVGKSLLTAGLCRIFKQDGYRTAPFKSQNMALNSYITQEGLEIGRAQAVQAEAAGILPTAAMNPILLKPTNDMGSQVIVNGTSIGTMAARDYFRYKKQLIPQIKLAYDSLDREYDIIVIEGAGSPAEINLKRDDIVNMGMAKMAQAPVLLVGDIDRGGVFAQIYGTVMLLEAEERARIKGLIINKFRGDKTILDPGVFMIEDLCKIPVVGVTPYLQVDIEDEDSLSRRLHERGTPAPIDIAVILFPRISNFTDFTVLSCHPSVSLRYVNKQSDLKNPDLLILPGTKNTVEDLLWMRQNGLEAGILRLASKGTLIFGICGGYQMLGGKLSDPLGAETELLGREAIWGMGLLPVETCFLSRKTTTRITGNFLPITGRLSKLSNIKIEGYEIHMGETTNNQANTALVNLEEYQNHSHTHKVDGCWRDTIFGCYVHGLFDGEGVADTLICILMEEKGLSLDADSKFHFQTYKENQYDLLAEGLRKSLKMDKIYKILEAGI